MNYIVEDWDTEEVIETFSNEEERSKWLAKNAKDGYLADGRRISIYEHRSTETGQYQIQCQQHNEAIH